MITIEITGGTFYNTRHPSAIPPRVIRVGDIFEVDSINSDGWAAYKVDYGGMIIDLLVDCKYWKAVGGTVDTINMGVESDDIACCTCDIILLMTTGCRCGWIEVERGR